MACDDGDLVRHLRKEAVEEGSCGIACTLQAFNIGAAVAAAVVIASAAEPATVAL